MARKQRNRPSRLQSLMAVFSRRDNFHYARVKANAPALSADETKGVAEGLGAGAAEVVWVTGGGGAAPFCSPPQLTVRRRAARTNTLRRTINTP